MCTTASVREGNKLRVPDRLKNCSGVQEKLIIVKHFDQKYVEDGTRNVYNIAGVKSIIVIFFLQNTVRTALEWI
jgi:hypothetical protein